MSQRSVGSGAVVVTALMLGMVAAIWATQRLEQSIPPHLREGRFETTEVGYKIRSAIEERCGKLPAGAWLDRVADGRLVLIGLGPEGCECAALWSEARCEAPTERGPSAAPPR